MIGRSIRIWCDHQKCLNKYEPIVHHKMKDIKAAAKTQGWIFKNSKHYCSKEHAEVKNENDL